MWISRTRGFTLIELLVVIAIIGILSAVVLASLNTARSKGQDAAIQSDISTIQLQAELYYGTNTATPNSYGTQVWYSGSAAGTNCTGGMFSNTTLQNALKAADSANGSGNAACVAAGTYYVVAFALVSPSPAAYWCADSSGVAKQVTGAVPTLAISSC